MTLSDFATFSTAVSGLAVTGSLIYLALQTHQSVKHTRALIHQGRATQIQALLSKISEPDIAELILRENGDDATPDAVRNYRFNRIAVMQFIAWDDSFSQYQSGLLGDDSFAATRKSIARVLEKPAFRLAWNNWKVPGAALAVLADEIVEASNSKRATRP